MESEGYGWTAFHGDRIAQESYPKGPLHVDVIRFIAPKAMVNYTRKILVHYDSVVRKMSITTVPCDLTIAIPGK
jgi:hypothetical protein